MRKLAAPGLEALKDREREQVEEHLGPDDEVRFSLRGVNDQSIVALSDRLLVVKPRWLAGGERVTPFYYSDITEIQPRLGRFSKMGFLEVLSSLSSPEHGKPKSYWTTGEASPQHSSNCIPIAGNKLKKYQPYLDELQQLIRDAPVPPELPSEGSLGERLQKLAELKDSGTITIDEFQRGKDKLLTEEMLHPQTLQPQQTGG